MQYGPLNLNCDQGRNTLLYIEDVSDPVEGEKGFVPTETEIHQFLITSGLLTNRTSMSWHCK